MVEYKQLFKFTFTAENMVNKKEIGDPVLGETFSTPFKTNSQHFLSRSGTDEQGLFRLIERFSYDLEK